MASPRSEFERPRPWTYRLLAVLAVAALAAAGGGATPAARLVTTAVYLGIVLGGLLLQPRLERTARSVWPLFVLIEVGASAFVVARNGPTASPLLLLLALPVVIWGLLREVRGGLCAALGAIAAEAWLLSHGAQAAETGAPGWSRLLFGGGAFHPVPLLLLGAVSGHLGRRIRRAEASQLSARAELEQMRLDADSILAHLSQGLLCVDAGGSLTRWNEEAAGLLGLDGARPGEATLQQLQESGGARELARYLRRRLEAAEEAAGEFHLDGRPVQVTTTPVRDSAGTARGLIVLLHDLTQLRAREEEDRRRERLAFIGELSAGLAHEIRNSLKPITGSVELLRREIPAGDSSRDTLMEIILREAEALENFLTEFLVFTRDRSRESAVLSVETILGEELESLSTLASGTFRLERPGTNEPELHVRADRSSLRQIMRNLGLNAMEAGSGVIEVGWRRLGAEAEVYVQDHGPGIPEEIRARVFDPFFTTKPSGTGLGLAIARDLVDRLGGRLLLLPVEGGGTRASIRLPLVQPAEAHEASPRRTALAA